MGTLKRKLSGDTRRAVQRYGPSINGLAERRYHISGAALLAKLVAGESGDDPNAVSSAGARGRAQFTAGSRRIAIQKYGIDPWKSADEAVHAAALHLRGKINGSKGLEGYNPGDPSYPSYILSQRVGKIGGGGGGLKGRLRETGAAQGAQAQAGASSLSAGAPAPLQLASQLRNPIQSVGIAPPSFSARPALPTGYQPMLSQGVAPAPSLAPDPAQGQAVDLSSPQQTAGSGGASAPSAGGKRGKVRIDPGADRPGVPTRPEVISFLERVAGRAGRPIRLGTGSRHSRMTVNGNVSDHWTGHAGDVPATGRRLIELGQAALIEAGMPVRKARKQTGGLFNVRKGKRRYQIIFNTQEGGDHTTHLHVGVEG